LDGEKVILKDQVLEVRNIDSRLHVARKVRRPDEWDHRSRSMTIMAQAIHTTSMSSRKRLRYYRKR
jgi:hypothetical protein